MEKREKKKNISFITQEKPIGTGNAIMLCENLINDDFDDKVIMKNGKLLV